MGRMIDHYLTWLRENATEREIEGGWNVLTLPFLDRHNDHLMVYVKEDGDGVRITEEGATIRDLRHYSEDIEGLDLGSDDRGEIAAVGTIEQFPRQLNMVLMAMMVIGGGPAR